MSELGLFISTSFVKQVAALFDSRTVIDSMIDEFGYRHLETLIPNIEKILARNHINYRDLQYIAADIGPGSFTGVRIGVSSARSLAQSLNIPIIGVSNLQAYLYEIPNTDIAVPFIDAKRKREYGAVFEHKENSWKPLTEYSDQPIEWYIDYVRQLGKLAVFIGNHQADISDFQFIIKEMPSVSSFRKAVSAGRALEYHEIHPLYIRKSDAESAKEKND